jgi:hypothetical protein
MSLSFHRSIEVARTLARLLCWRDFEVEKSCHEGSEEEGSFSVPGSHDPEADGVG